MVGLVKNTFCIEIFKSHNVVWLDYAVCIHSDSIKLIRVPSTLTLNGIHDSGGVCSMFRRVQSFSSEKRTRGEQLPLREAITGSNKGAEVHSTEAIFGTSLPLAVHLFSLAQRNR